MTQPPVSTDSEPFEILFAPVFKAEQWLSIELQEADILASLRRNHPALRITEWQPDTAKTLSRLSRFTQRDLSYPLALARQARAMRRDGRQPILHISDHSYGHLCLASQPCVINCNDFNHYVQPTLQGLSLKLWRARVNQMRRAAAIITISHHLAGEVKEHLKLGDDQVIGIPGGIDQDTFHLMPLQAAATRMPALASLRENHLLITNIGSNVPRKNLPTVLRALAQLKHAAHLPVKLIKVGHPLHTSEHAALLHQLGIAEDVIDLGMLLPADVAAVCRLTHALSFASRYEGFGRPTLEAQACGLPCVLADSSCMKEVGGEGALYHQPMDVDALAHQLQLALTHTTTRDQLIAKGLANAARFSWDHYAHNLMDVYRRAASH